ncbi:alpha-1,6-mannosylglycoprotein 6-beta-N-acetylglucosaminyltransferase A-like [Dendronephthya gigantea]|uniref:alpha-1,6-mannosylglycoprotein 6-beta-N-acetylglucosaminyltransferase A-like n=1 Tax=Dendronephthya gigantea TaxID=151771 RepID=UPI00106AC2EB|nr:alpha-1,6-mannosylglycoprotein 6-beta-N-acetylglucosaminyltransferase A-like [Dendronephthya gigantea]
MLIEAFYGGPLGELVQWSDVVASLYLLGHDITIVKSLNESERYTPGPDKNGCINSSTVQQFEYDLIYTDIIGAFHMKYFSGPYWSEIRCKMRILDSFGTEAEFNYIKLVDNDNKKYKSSYGKLSLNLRQFMTMFPHSPDNSFLGFVSGAAQRISKKSKTYAKRNMALVYAKLDSYWKVDNRAYLDKIHEYVEIHGTFTRTVAKSKYIPKDVINHGVVNRTTIEKLLQQSKVFVGLGFPFEGPAPLEAVANGAAFINPKVSLNRHFPKFA